MLGILRGPVDDRWPIEVSQVTIRSSRLPQALDGLRIALMTDIHFGRRVRADYVRRIFRLAVQQRPDVAILGGDTVDTTRANLPELAGLLPALAGQVSTFAVLGNHDRYGPYLGSLLRVLAGAGVEVLTNRHRLIARDGAGLPVRAGGPSGDGDGPAIALVGVDDIIGGWPDFPAAASGIPRGAFTIVATHCPDLADTIPTGSVDLMLAGHTHGGQVCLFGWPVVTLTRNRTYTRGLVAGPGFPIYVSRGLGVTGISLRVGATPELPIITLRRP